MTLSLTISMSISIWNLW